MNNQNEYGLEVERNSEGFKVFPTSGEWPKGGLAIAEIAEQVLAMGFEVRADCYSFTNANEHFPELGCLESVQAVIFFID